jgi:hypothetical protein
MYMVLRSEQQLVSPAVRFALNGQYATYDEQLLVEWPGCECRNLAVDRQEMQYAAGEQDGRMLGDDGRRCLTLN